MQLLTVVPAAAALLLAATPAQTAGAGTPNNSTNVTAAGSVQSQPAVNPAAPPVVQGAPRFATAVGGKLLGLPDAAAPAIRDLRPGEPMVVVGHQGSILEVEVPGGITAWIYASYLREGKSEGTMETIEDGVNLRPQPRSDAKTIPIARAKKGQSFVVLGRSQDWVQVVCPSDLHGYVLLTDVVVSNDPPSAHEAELTAGRKWAEEARVAAVETEKRRREEERKRKEEEEKRREAQRRESEARASCARAMEMLRGTPDASTRTRAKDLLDAAAKLTTSEAVAADVKRGLERIELVAFLEKEREEERIREEKEREAKIKEAEERMQRVQTILDGQKDPKPIDPFGARFAGMGEVQRGLELPRGRVYTLSKGGRVLFYLTCPSKRYDVSDFLGREVGVIGAIKQIEGYPARVIEVERIEVLAN